MPHEPATSTLALIADDFGLTAGVNRGILELIETRRISGTGAMTNRPAFRAEAATLRALAARADIGVHLNLTIGTPLSRAAALAPQGTLPPLGAIVRGALSGALPLADIKVEIANQLAAFEDSTGLPPCFVDGHQHVHALPGVRRVLMEALCERNYAPRPYLRDPADKIRAILVRGRHVAKALVVASLARGFGSLARRAGFRTNVGFSGFSNFTRDADLAADFAGALTALGPRHLIMCHPGEIDDELRRLDPAVESRPREFIYLMSGSFDQLLSARGLTLARFI